MFRKSISCATSALLAIATLIPSLASAAPGAAPAKPGAAAAQGGDYYAPAPAPKPGVAKPPAAQPEAQPIELPEPSEMTESQDPLMRLASVPNMFGDSTSLGARLLPWEASYHDLFGPSVYPSPSLLTGTDLAPGGAARRMKIAENNKALPTDRVYFNYNHFQNALQESSFRGPTRDISLDQYTIGFEKTFRDGLWSVEVRMPFTGGYRYYAPDQGAGTGSFGNLALDLKRRLFVTDSCLVAAGLGISTPTGSDALGYVNGSPFVVHNDAVNLAPWVGFLSDRFDPLFLQGFLQVDVPLNGDRVLLSNQLLGRYNEQTLMYLDLEMGYWLFRDRPGLITAMAAVLEFHYTTTLQNTDLVAGSVGASSLTVVNVANRVDVVNMTIGLETHIGPLTRLGIGGVVPLDIYPDRLFDGEVQIFLNRYF